MAGERGALPRRRGQRPSTTSRIPHVQLDQQPTDVAVIDSLARRVFALPGVSRGPSGVSVPGATAAILDDVVPTVGEFLIGREFAHIHPGPDHSMHVALPPGLAERVIELGWAERHMLAGTPGVPIGTVMIYAPRDPAEVDTVVAIIAEGHRCLIGDPATSPSP